MEDDTLTLENSNDMLEDYTSTSADINATLERTIEGSGACKLENDGGQDDEVESRAGEEIQSASEDENWDSDWTALHHAASHVDLTGLRKHLTSGGCDVNRPTKGTLHTALHLVVINSSFVPLDYLFEAIRLLVQHGADLNVHDYENHTPLHECATHKEGKYVAIGQKLIELGADVNANLRPSQREEHYRQNQGHKGCCCCGANVGQTIRALTGEQQGRAALYNGKVTPLHLACRDGIVEMTKMLLKNGAKINLLDNESGTPLHEAALRGNSEICELLMGYEEGKSCLEAADKYGRTPICIVAESAAAPVDIARLFLEKGSLVDFVIGGNSFRTGSTPLALVCDNSQREKKQNEGFVRLFLDFGADPNKMGENRKPVLARAIKNGNAQVVKMLLEKGASFKSLEDLDASPLHVAATEGSAELCKCLIEEYGMDVNQRSTEGDLYTPLILAAGYNNSAELIPTLVALGADIQASIYDGRTALHFAAFKGQLNCARELLNLGADIDCEDDNAWTPLHFAARYHKIDIVTLLLENGAKLGKTVMGGPCPKLADAEEIAIDGFTAADLAKIIRGGREVVDLLVDAGDTISEATKHFKDEDLWEDKLMWIRCAQ